MKLVSVYDTRPHGHLYDLLAERTPEQSISHKAMPDFANHCDFVDSKPYFAWYLIVGDGVLGCCYLSKNREIGVSVYKAQRGKGIGKWAVRELMRLHPGGHLANINPHNTASIRLFEGLGFNLLQHTYAK